MKLRLLSPPFLSAGLHTRFMIRPATLDIIGQHFRHSEFLFFLFRRHIDIDISSS